MKVTNLIPTTLYNRNPVFNDGHGVGMRLAQDRVSESDRVVLVSLLLVQLSYEALVVEDLLLCLLVSFGELARESKLGLRVRQPFK